VTELSVVIPVHDERAVLVELVERVASAARRTSLSFELVVVDDASRDGSAALLRELADDAHVRPVWLDRQHGQFGATKEGLRAARSPKVVVLDGDLQDPPERIPLLVASLGEAPHEDLVVFGVKSSVGGPAWFRIGRYGYHAIQRALPSQIPAGAGSYCAMSLSMARRVADVPVRDANLAAVLVALGARPKTVPYEKATRYDERSRVGPVGLAREALGSLLLLTRWGRRRALGRGPLA